jgi:hypothetical protein
MLETFLQEVTNNIGFTLTVSDTTWVVLQIVLSKTNVIGDTKHNIELVTIIVFGACIQSMKHLYAWHLFLEPHQSTYHSNIGVSLRNENKTKVIYPVHVHNTYHQGGIFIYFG